MENQFTRTAIVLGDDALLKLSHCRVAVFGLGGVGGYVVEALARAGVGTLDLIDGDRVSVTNINRQIIALHTSIGRFKADVAKERVLQINPDICANERKIFFDEDTQSLFEFTAYDYVVDAIDSVKSKLLLAELCDKYSTPLIACMGTGNKLDPTAFKVADIYKTSVCPLARVMRRELKKRGIEKLKVVYSEEQPIERTDGESGTVGSVPFVPPAAGLLLAASVITDLLKIR